MAYKFKKLVWFKFCVNPDRSAAETPWNASSDFGEHSLGWPQVSEWHVGFKASLVSVQGRPIITKGPETVGTHALGSWPSDPSFVSHGRNHQWNLEGDSYWKSEHVSRYCEVFFGSWHCIRSIGLLACALSFVRRPTMTQLSFIVSSRLIKFKLI